MMTVQTVTIDLPEPLYRSANQVAQATNRPLADVLRESLVHGLPPLDDVPLEEADELAHLSSLDDAALWQASFTTMSTIEQAELNHLLTRQSAGALSLHDESRLQILMDEYSRLLVRKAHAWLLLARRGYRVAPQKGQG
jgi:hypothetical protein